jgi:nicotinamide mononucleotide (NMN) deamidase PncC
VGTVFIAVVGPREAGETVAELDLSGDRNTIRALSVEHAVGLLLDELEANEVSGE